MILVQILLLGLTAFASGPFKNLADIQKNLGFNAYYKAQTTNTVKVAILDKGFAGFEKEIGATLPADTTYFAGPINTPESEGIEHGLKMAQLVTALMSNNNQSAQLSPQLYLYNVYGYSNFKAAIDDLIANQVDIVLYAEVWEYGGNHDGKGFINAEVSRATDAGVVWINAAGNFARTTFNSNIKTAKDEWVEFPNNNRSLEIRCEKNPAGSCPVKIVLSWNDFKDDVEIGTDKDLDLALTDDLLNIIQSSALKQSDDVNESRPGYSKYPREIITAELEPGTYYIRAKNRSQNFGSKDSLRITVDGDAITMPSAQSRESLLNPADNASVITVGASDSDRSSSSSKLGKPDLVTASTLITDEGVEYRGSSNAAAIVASGVALMKALEPSLDSKTILQKVRGNGGGTGWDQTGLTLNLLGFSFTGPGCFIEVKLQNIPAHLQDVLDNGGVFVQTTRGIRIMTPYDPIQLDANLRRQLLNDMIMTTPLGFRIFQRYNTGGLPNDWVEVFQRPLEAGLCGVPQNGNGSGKNFRLPAPKRNP